MMIRSGRWVYAIVTLFLIMALSVPGVVAQDQPPTSEESLEDMFETKKTEEEYYRTDRVLLTATKNLMDARKAPAINTVITENEIRNMGARTLDDVLRNVPGLTTYQPEALRGNSDLGVRGIRTAYSEKILLLIDGHRANESYSGGFILAFADLTVENIKRLEIVRGPGSALYGTSAFVAVINVITKTAEDIDGQQFTAGFGSHDTQHYNGLFSHKAGKFKISGHADYVDTDGASSFIEQDALLSSGETLEFMEKHDVGLKMGFGDISFSGRLINRETGSYMSPLLGINDNSNFEFRNIMCDLVYKKDISDDFDIMAKLYGDEFQFDLYYEMYPKNFTGAGDIGLIGNPQLTNRTLGGEITSNYVLGDHLLTAGMSYEYIEQDDVDAVDNFANPFAEPTTPAIMFQQEVERKVWAAYLQYMWEITAYDSLTVGVRYDNYDDFGDTVNPRAGYVHEFKNNLIVKALYGSAFRAPMFTELYSQGNPALLGNSDLDAEKISTYEAGIEYPFMKHYTLRFNYFHNVIEDMIAPQPIAGGGQQIANSSGETKVDGVETEFGFEFAKDKYGYINCSYQDGEDNNGNTLIEVSHWLANAGLNYGLSDHLSMNVNVQWTGDRIRAESDTREDLSSNTLVNLTFIAKNFYKTLEMRASLYNAFDEDFRDPSPNAQVPNDFPANTQMAIFEARYKF